jgi:hypothetical protein
MKTAWRYLTLSAMLVCSAGISQADRGRAWIVVNPFPLVVVRPVVEAQPVAQPVVVPDPYAAPPVDYGRVLADFHSRVQRMQRLLDRQLNRRIISTAQYDRHAEDLDQIVRDEQRFAARHNGALTPREVDELNRRLTELQDRIHEDLAR